MKQIIHCNHNHYHEGVPAKSGKRCMSGSTWMLSSIEGKPREVCVQYIVCTPQDNYCRKVGRELAATSREIVMLKSELPTFIESTAWEHNWRVLVPSSQQVYQAIIRL